MYTWNKAIIYNFLNVEIIIQLINFNKLYFIVKIPCSRQPLFGFKEGIG